MKLSPGAQAAASGVNAFTLDLYNRARVADKNLFLSPASVSTAVALAYRGAAGVTADELRRVFHYDAAPAAYLRSSAELFGSMNLDRPGRLLQIANSIWVQNGMPLHADYVSDVHDLMKAGLQQADFERDPGGSRTHINAWVAAATRDRIRDLLSADDVTRNTRSVLVNAIYWKGRWQALFNADDTRSETFTGLDGAKRPARLMHQRDHFAVVERDGVQAVALPYVGGEVSMVVFLPRNARGLPKYEAELTEPEFAHWFAALDAAQARDTLLTLPKMHLEAKFDLAQTLADMGAPTAFAPSADFSGTVTPPPALALSKVIHAAWLDVDEEGAEAVAVTAVTQVVVSGTILGPPPPPPIVFRADRPFLFLLRDNRTGLILFIGRYVTP